MSVFAIVMIVAAASLLIAAEWPRLERIGAARRARDRAKRKSRLHVVEDDDFARSVERDLASLPTIDEHER